uniref:Arf-GAP with coiled-coil, ANK repeat and PH domain-containing protein n=1 Tax=Laticauda laticaudata TaxID=8630 RepID=A0A8C5SF01_LATLA
MFIKNKNNFKIKRKLKNIFLKSELKGTKNPKYLTTPHLKTEKAIATITFMNFDINRLSSSYDQTAPQIFVINFPLLAKFTTVSLNNGSVAVVNRGLPVSLLGPGSNIFSFLSHFRTCLLQADSECHLQAWMCAVQSSIASAYNEDHPESPGQVRSNASLTAATLQSPSSRKLRGGVDKHVVDQVQRLEGNAQCCDCREAAPEWASINLGITLCIECSGIHRSLGVHFSKVRSLTLDAWEPELVKLMTVLGNQVINQIYEARVEEMNMKRPQPGSSRSEKEAWIRAKYVEKKFITKFPNAGIPLSRCREPGGQERSPRPFPKPKPPGQIRLREGVSPSRAPPPSEDLRHLHPGALLYRAASAPPSLPTMSDALAHGADVNWVNTAQESRTPLLQAVAANSLLACEFLLQNGANVNQSDNKGQGPLHHATILGHTGLACLFLKRGANMNAVDGEGKDPLGIAIDSANADIVTLLRLAKMREAELALGQSGDETYLDIFQDFSFMASNDPEKLARKAYDFKLTTF